LDAATEDLGERTVEIVVDAANLATLAQAMVRWSPPTGHRLR
jgi:hypothetical protein